MQSDVLRFSCPRCEAPLRARPDAIGRPLACPKCQGQLTVPDFPAGGWDDQEEFQLRPSDSPQASADDDQLYVPVNCSVCHTRMFAGEQEVGQMMACPDCGHENLVSGDPAVEAAKAKNASTSFDPLLDDDGANPFDEEERGAEDDELFGEAGLPSPDAYIPVTCKKCATRFYATDDDIGHRLNCPDCQSLNVVQPPAEGVTKPDRSVYDINDAPRVAAPGTRLEDYDIVLEKEATLPDHPMITGVISFPLYTDVLLRWLLLSTWCAVTLIVCLNIIAGGATGSAGSSFQGRATNLGILLLVSLFGGTSMLLWTVLAGMNFLHVVTDTAIGNDRLSEWPDSRFFENLSQFIFIAVAFLLSGAPGAILVVPLAPLVPDSLEYRYVVYGIAGGLSVYLFFPYFLLSMGEAESPFIPISGSVLRKMRERPAVWAAVYFESAILIALVVGVDLLVYGIVHATGINPLWQIIPAVYVGCWALFVYFRLIGRAAWCFEYADRKDYRMQQQAEKRAKEAAFRT